MIIHSFGEERPAIPTLHHGGSVIATIEDNGELSFIEGLPVGRKEKHAVSREDFIVGKFSHVAALLGDEKLLAVGTEEGLRSLLDKAEEGEAAKLQVEHYKQQLADSEQAYKQLKEENEKLRMFARQAIARTKQLEEQRQELEVIPSTSHPTIKPSQVSANILRQQ